MISLPSLAGVPPVLSTAPADRLAAQCVLALAGDGPIQRVRSQKDSIEHALLKLQLEARLFAAAKPLEIFRPKIHAHLGDVPEPCECSARATSPVTIWLGNANGKAVDTQWILERRWTAIERGAPGLAATALEILDDAKWAGAPLYTPQIALGTAQYTWWMGEEDERYILEEVREQYDGEEPEEDTKPLTDEQLAERVGLVTRARLDKSLPTIVTEARKMPRKQLARLARGRGQHAELARRVETLWQALDAFKRKAKYSIHTQQDQLWTIGYPATLRWNLRDPMYRILDDHANRLMESSDAVEEAWGWFIVDSPKDLPAFFTALERRLAIARMEEQVLELLADRRKG